MTNVRRQGGAGEVENQAHLRRHAQYALEDFRMLRHERDSEALWHALSHHLRHIAYRAGVTGVRHNTRE